MLNAFCRVAPSVRFSLSAIRDARFFWRAIVFKVRICSAVHARRFLAFLAIEQLPVSEKVSCSWKGPMSKSLKAAARCESQLSHVFAQLGAVGCAGTRLTGAVDLSVLDWT
jgi:hypothetical protein